MGANDGAYCINSNIDVEPNHCATVFVCYLHDVTQGSLRFPPLHYPSLWTLCRLGFQRDLIATRESVQASDLLIRLLRD